MKRLVFAAVSALSLASFAQTPEEQKTIDAFLYGSLDQAAKEAAVVKLLDAKPALAKSTALLITGLDSADVKGDLGVRAKKLAQLALAHGADPNGTDKDGMPLLIKYAMFARVGPMELLLAKGANPNATDADKSTALHWLASMSELDKEQVTIDGVKAAATLLLDKKADVNAKNKRGATPLHISAHNGAKAFSELLLARGADMNAVDSAGYSVLGGALLRVGTSKDQPTFANDKEKAATRAVIEVLKKKGAKDVHP